jgi:hypothetical protein
MSNTLLVSGHHDLLLSLTAMRNPKPLNLHDDIPILIYNDEAEEITDMDMTWYNDADAGGFLVNFGVKNRLKKLNEVDYSWLEWVKRTFQPNTKVSSTSFLLFAIKLAVIA